MSDDNYGASPCPLANRPAAPIVGRTPMIRHIIRHRPLLIGCGVTFILLLDASNQLEVPMRHVPGEVYDRYLSTLRADDPPARLLEEAKAGNTQAQYIYALRHTRYAPTDLQINPDPAVAFEWMSKAAENRHPRAMAVLALYYFNGIGTAKDEAKSREWAQKAAEKGQPMGIRLLGEIRAAEASRLEHQFKQQNLTKPETNQEFQAARKLMQARRNELRKESYLEIERAAKMGDSAALRMLGKAYEEGHPGFTQNFRLAIDYYTQAALKRDTVAMQLLAEHYECGTTTVVNLASAYAWRLVIYELSGEDNDRAYLGELRKRMGLSEILAGQEQAGVALKQLPSENDAALARLAQSR